MTEAKSRAAVLTEISLIFAAVFWGLNFAATKYAAESIPPLVIVALRFTGGGLLLLLILRLLEPESRPGRKDLILMAALGCFGVAIAQSGFTFGVSHGSEWSTSPIQTWSVGGKHLAQRFCGIRERGASILLAHKWLKSSLRVSVC